MHEVEVAAVADRVRHVTGGADLAGFRLHVDVDVLDPKHMPAVDGPDPGGLEPDALTALLAALSPMAGGAQITIFDPDLDPDARYARLVVDILSVGLRALGAARRVS